MAAKRAAPSFDRAQPARAASDGDGSAPRGLTTLTILRFPSGQRRWAFAQMGLARRRLSRVPGLGFWRLLGSGEGGFGLRPDLSRYGFLGVWRTPALADEHLGGPALSGFFERAEEAWTVRMSVVTTRGTWAGQSPFPAVDAVLKPSDPVAILTRATLRLARLDAFWRAVPTASAAVANADGRLLSIGIGELPFVRQGTFSVWRTLDDARRFAYASGCPHLDIVRRTRDEGWYAEDLFARFSPRTSEGTLEGRDPLAGLLPHRAGHPSPPEE